MASLGMDGAHDLTAENVDEVVTSTSPGNYALGRTNDQGRFVPKYVGRSDSDVAARLRVHAAEGKYREFKFSYADSARKAFDKECRNYHDFESQLDNEAHPQRPSGKDWPCPVAECFEL